MLLNNLLPTIFLCLLSTIYPVQAVKYYISLSGIKTGNLYHNTLSNFTNVTPIANFSFSASQAYDMATGNPGGKLQFVPITVEKEMDGASANLALLLSTRQSLIATVYGLENGTSGHPATQLVWKFQQGFITSLKHEMRPTQMVETFSMIFQNLVFETTSGAGFLSTPFGVNA